MSVADEILRLQNDSAAIASAIAAKGVTVPSGSGYDDYATLIGQISGGGGSPLPYDAEVEYIAANGTQYINTGVTPAYGSTKVVIDCQFTGDYTTTQIIVGYGSASGKFAGNINKYYGVGGGSTSKLTVTSSTRTPIIVSFSTNKRTDITNGLSSAYVTTSATLTADNPITLFMGGTGYYSTAKIFACRIYTGETLTLDLIPVRVGTVGQMYDQINNTFYTNAGTGNFSYGSDVQ